MNKRQKKPANIGEIAPNFSEYYKKILVPSQMTEEEFNSMMDLYKIHLPLVFRISKDTFGYDKLCKEADSLIDDLTKKGIDAIKKDSLPPEFGAIYQINMSSASIRKDEVAQPIKQFVNENSKLGLVHRQELVSMVPHHFLNVQPDSSVLDLCAAPGSKTAQIVESLTSPDGFVIANDVELKRCFNLIHQIQRIGMSKVLVTSNQAQHFPDPGLQFDRVLCDVPCSGDGTLRKDANAGARWKTSGGAALHGLQRSILKRGIELLKVGGRLVYSTCSMNPIEDEAVIGSVLAEMGDAVQLVDVSKEHPKLKRMKGLTNWPVLTDIDGTLTEYKSVTDVPAEKKHQTCPSMFPTQNEQLERCMRFYPQLENSGGFFVAVLTKVAELEKVSSPPKPARELGEAPYLDIEKSSPELLNEINQQFQPDNIDELKLQMFVRNESKARSVYLLSKPLSEIIRREGSERLRVVSGGVPLFRRQAVGKEKRETLYPALEGVQTVLAHATRRRVELSLEDLERMLSAGHSGVPFTQLAETAAKQMEEEGGALFFNPKTQIAFGGIVFPASAAAYIAKDQLPIELMRLNRYK